jgi:hypothetical protein
MSHTQIAREEVRKQLNGPLRLWSPRILNLVEMMTAWLTQIFAVPSEDHWRRRKQVFAVPLHALKVRRRK